MTDSIIDDRLNRAESAPATDSPPAAPSTRSVCLAFALGCPRAESETARLSEYIRANGWAVAPSIEEADTIIVMGCGYSTDYEERSVSLLRSVDARRKAGSQLVIVGCLAGISDQLLHETFDAVTVPSRRPAALDETLAATVPFERIQDPGELEPYIAETSRHFTEAERHPSDTWAMRRVRDLSTRTGLKDWVLRTRGRNDESLTSSAERVCSIRVASGCPGECTYCAIKFAAGPLKSKPLDTILEEFDRGLAQGFTEFRMIAGDFGSYGQDIGTSVAELLEQMLRRPGNYKLTLLDFDLKYFIQYEDSLIDLLEANAARIRSIDMPMQSGSERILAAMRRGHTAADAERVLCAFRERCPTISVRSHVLVGFPGETEQDFEDSLRLVRVGRFNYVTFYDYTDRPRTEAAMMTNKVPESIIRARSLRAHREFNGRWDALRYRAKAWGLR